MVTQPQSATPPTSLTIHDPDLAHALGVLRATPAADLSAIRTLRIVMTEASLLRWHGSLWPGAHATLDDEDLDDYARLYPVPSSTAASSGGSGDPPSEAFRALLRFVDGSFDVAGLGLEIDAGGAAWGIFEDKGAGAYAGWDEVERDWGFVYEFYLDVGRTLAEVFGVGRLRELCVKTSIWDKMGTSLAERISGNETVVDGEVPNGLCYDQARGV